MGSLVQVKEATVITPSNHTPSSILPLSSLDSQLFLRFTIEYLLIFSPPISKSLSSTLKSSLSRSLTPYFPLSGRVRQREDSSLSLEVNCNNQGALFLEAESNNLTCLDFTKAPRHVTSWRKLLSVNVIDVLGGAPPLVVQLTWLRDGGVALAFGVNHCVSDGIGSAEFLSLFAEFARDELSLKNELSRKHVWDRYLLNPIVTHELLSQKHEFDRSQKYLWDSLSHHHELDRDSLSQAELKRKQLRDGQLLPRDSLSQNELKWNSLINHPELSKDSLSHHYELYRDSLSQTELKRKQLLDRQLLNPMVNHSLSHHHELDRDSLSHHHELSRDSLSNHHELSRDSLSHTELKQKQRLDRQLLKPSPIRDSLSHHHELSKSQTELKRNHLWDRQLLNQTVPELSKDSLSQKHLWDRQLLNPCPIRDSLSHHHDLSRDSLSQNHLRNRQLLTTTVRDSLSHHHELYRDSSNQTELKRNQLRDHQLLTRDSLSQTESKRNSPINHPEFNRVPDLCGFINRFNVERLVPTSIVFEKQRLNELKNLASHQLSESNSKHTSFEVLSAHIWRSWARSLNLPSNQIIKLLFSINIRDRVKPSLPKGFYGNAFVVGCAQTTVKDLTEKGLSYATMLVKQAKDRVNDDYVRSVVEAVSESKKASPDLVGVLILSQWSRLGLEKLDFGFGKPVHLGSVCCDRYCLFLPVPGKSDAVKVMVAVPSSAVDSYENLVISPNA